MTPGLTPLQRLLLWDHERGSLAYDALLLALALFLLAAPAFIGDPMVLP